LLDIQRLSPNYFHPLQPEFEMNTRYYVEQKERDRENQSTFLFYQFKMNEGFANPISVIPDGCIDILFCCDKQQPTANVCGSVLQSKSINLKAGYEYFGVRFLPKQETQNLNCQMSEMIEREVPLTDIFSTGAAALEKVVNERDFHKRIQLFKQMIGTTIFASGNSSPSIIKYALNKIYLSKGNITINQLADETGYSTRYLRKQFEENIGISPKLFSQIVRFQYSLYMLLKEYDYSIKDIIVENGYYDQAHLINEFKKFGNLTPNTISKRMAISI